MTGFTDAGGTIKEQIWHPLGTQDFSTLRDRRSRRPTRTSCSSAPPVAPTPSCSGQAWTGFGLKDDPAHRQLLLRRPGPAARSGRSRRRASPASATGPRAVTRPRSRHSSRPTRPSTTRSRRCTRPGSYLMAQVIAERARADRRRGRRRGFVDGRPGLIARRQRLRPDRLRRHEQHRRRGQPRARRGPRRRHVLERRRRDDPGRQPVLDLRQGRVPGQPGVQPRLHRPVTPSQRRMTDAAGSRPLVGPADGGQPPLRSAGSSAVRRLTAVDRVTSCWRRASGLGIIGPNGAGKTTLFRLIAGEMRPTDGRIELLGRDVTRMPAHRRAGLGLARTFQVSNLFGGLSVLDNVRLASQARGRDRLAVLESHVRATTSRAAQLARRSSASAWRAVRRPAWPTCRTASSASSRSRWRSSREPRLLLLDEPAAGLAIAERGRLRALLEALPRTLPVAPHRARHVAGARTRRPGHVPAQRQGRRIRDARRCAARRDASRPSTSAGRSPVLEVVDLEAGYASARRPQRDLR